MAEPDRPFVMAAERRRLGYAEFNSDVNRLANGLIEEGIGKGDRVVLGLADGLQALTASFALRKLGAIEVCVPAQTATAAVDTLLESFEPEAVITAGALPSGVADLHSRRIDLDDLASGRTDDPATDFDDAYPEAILVEKCGDDTPRGNVVTHRAAAAMGLTMVTALGIREDDCLCSALPNSPIESRYLTAGAALWAGCRIAVCSDFHPDDFWAQCKQAGVTAFGFNAGVLTSLWDQPARAADADNGVRLGWGAPIPLFGPLFEERFGVRLAPGYGAPAAGIVTWRDPREKGEPYGSSGRVVPPFEIRIADRYDDPLPAGEVGEILIRSRDSNLIGADRPHISTSRTPMVRNMWLHTGDYGHLDAAGRLFVLGRRIPGEDLVLGERVGLGGPFGTPLPVDTRFVRTLARSGKFDRSTLAGLSICM